MRVDFDEKDHVYAVNGDIASISVTELLRKHGLAPNYEGVGKARLKAASEKGKAVHKSLEKIIVDGIDKAEPETVQAKQFQDWARDHIEWAKAETSIGYEVNGLTIAGTADIFGLTKDGALFVGDHKNTSSFHEEYVSWQVSLYDFFLRALGDEDLNGEYLHWKGATRFYCFWYNTAKNGHLEVRRLHKISDSEIMRLLVCEVKGEIYHRQALIVDKDLADKVVAAEKYLTEVENALKQAKAASDRMRAKMLSVFQEQGVSSWESPNGEVKVTYTPEYDRVSVDSSKLKKEFPQAWSNCQKITKVRASLRVKVKGADDKESDEKI